MKKDLRHHSFSLFNQVKGTKNFLHTTSSEAKFADNHTNIGANYTNITSIASFKTDAATTALSIVDFLIGMGNKAKLISQSKRSNFYQVTLFDYTPREVSDTWVPLLGAEGIEAEITVSLLGEKCILHTCFSNIPSLHTRKNGRFYLEVRSIEELIHWYHETFSEVKTEQKQTIANTLDFDKAEEQPQDRYHESNSIPYDLDPITLNQKL